MYTNCGFFTWSQYLLLLILLCVALIVVESLEFKDSGLKTYFCIPVVPCYVPAALRSCVRNAHNKTSRITARFFARLDALSSQRILYIIILPSFAVMFKLHFAWNHICSILGAKILWHFVRSIVHQYDALEIPHKRTLDMNQRKGEGGETLRSFTLAPPPVFSPCITCMCLVTIAYFQCLSNIRTVSRRHWHSLKLSCREKSCGCGRGYRENIEGWKKCRKR
jgi:hypothetical protein